MFVLYLDGRKDDYLLRSTLFQRSYRLVYRVDVASAKFDKLRILEYIIVSFSDMLGAILGRYRLRIVFVRILVGFCTILRRYVPIRRGLQGVFV